MPSDSSTLMTQDASTDLARFLRSSPQDCGLSMADYVARGGTLVTADAIKQLRLLDGALRKKIASIPDSERLVRRLNVLAEFFRDQAVIPARAFSDSAREITFALLYFLKGFDQIPDHLPEIGYVDDAWVVAHVLERNEPALRQHWLRRQRTWPENL